jgi:acetylornithine deacetylase/succinyl-diaminopimelate desuccinylase-like protein
MKHMAAMTLATVRGMLANDEPPARDVVLAFVADEEAGGEHGAAHLVRDHPSVFDGYTDAIGEVGGFSVTMPDNRRIYPVQVAEKGVLWLELRHRDVTALCAGLARVGRHEFTGVDLPANRELLSRVGRPDVVGRVPMLRRMIESGARHTANPTMLQDRGSPVAVLDGRFLPGQVAEFRRELDEVLGPDFDVSVVRHSPSVENPHDTAFFRSLRQSVQKIDKTADVAPYLLSAGTDAKWFAQLGINCYGFTPLWLPPRFDYLGLFHGVDERVPVDALGFGCAVLRELLLH